MLAFDGLQDLHARFEPLLLFFIDGAQIIEKGDPKWDMLMLIQPTPKGNLLVRSWTADWLSSPSAVPAPSSERACLVLA